LRDARRQAASEDPVVVPASRRTRVPFASILGYGAGNFAFSLLGTRRRGQLAVLLHGLRRALAGLVAWALLFARLFDAFVDPLMGWLSDRTHTRFGRRRPWMLGAALPLGVAFYALFAPPQLEGQGALLGYLMLLYTGTFLLWTVGAIPYYSLGAEMTDDYHERTQLIAVREAGTRGSALRDDPAAYLIHLRGGRDGYAAMGAILGAATALFPVRRGRGEPRAARVLGARLDASVPRHRANAPESALPGRCSRRSRSRRSRVRCPRRW